MNLSVILNVHRDEYLIKDAIEAVKAYATDQIILLVDGIAWNWAKNINFKVNKLQGLPHNYHKGPYRNLILGFQQTLKTYPNSDWIAHIEADTLFTSDDFKDDLDDDYWAIGTNLRTYNLKLPYLEKIVEQEIQETKYFLGCCIFYHRDFLDVLSKKNFWEKFLFYTNSFQNGFFPGFQEFDFGEHLLPTLVHNYGGKLKELSSWNENYGIWKGNAEKYPIRWKPELDINQDQYANTSIIHPLKDVFSPIRTFHREKRRRIRNAKRIGN